MKSTIRISFLLFLIAAGLAGCATPLTGTWRNVRQNGQPVPKGQQMTTTFGNFGRVHITDVRTSTRSDGSYALRDGLITLTADGHAQTFRYELAGDELRLKGAGSSVLMRRDVSRR